MSNHNKLIVQTAYLAWLRSELRLLPVIPIKAADRAARLPLAEVYVQLRVIERAQIEEFQRLTRGEFEPEREYRRRAEALENLKQSEGVFALFSDPSPDAKKRKGQTSAQQPVERMLLIGDAGSGKTTTLHFGALALADALLRNDPAGAEQHLGFHGDPLPLPVYMRLTLAMKWLRDTPEGRQCATAADPLLDWLDSQVTSQVTAFLKLREEQPVETPAGEPELPSPSAWQKALADMPLSALIRAGGCLLLLDGLDETGDTPRRVEMQRWIAGLAQSCPQNRYLVASRPFKDSAIPGFIERHLSPLNSDEMKDLLGKWFGAAYRNDPGRPQQRSASDEVGYLWGILERNPRLFDMCTNPLLLTSVALLVYTGVGLPRERAELYNRLVYLLLETWRVLQLTGGKLPESQAAKPVLFGESVGSVQRRLQQLAAWMQVAQRREVTLEEVAGQLAPQYAEDMEWSAKEAQSYVTKLLDSLALDSGILQRRDAGYSFAHYTLQEYLTARDYDQRPDGVTQLLALRNEARWKETILLAVGHWATSGVTDKARALLRGLLDANEPEALLLAGDALDDADAGRVPELAPVRRAATARLRALAALTDDWRSAAHPDPVLRNRAATMLDRLDADSDRPGLDLTRPDYWATRIEPGVFSMGDDNGMFDDEKPQFDYTIRRPYALARFPVTNRQYLLFVEALAKRGTAEAVAAANRLKDLMKQHGETPETYDGFRPSYWPGARYRAGEGNHPVVGVTWYAATAFAWWADAWLRSPGALTEGEEVRLPTEAEWERAAAYPPELSTLSRPQAVSKGAGGNPRDGRRAYPWGADLTTTTGGSITASIQANTSESQIKSTSVVGIFPHGAAACGAEELSGNVWEWCSTPMLNYPFKGEVSAESLYTENKSADSAYVLRGGSWSLTRDVARCAYRDVGYPRHVLDLTGFRLARLFSLSSSSCLFDIVKGFVRPSGCDSRQGVWGTASPPPAPQARIAYFFMKTYRNLYPQVYDFANLYESYRAARRAKRDRAEVARFEARVEDQLFRLQDELRDETYQPGAYRHFYIYEPKKRKISAAPFRDRVAHHALVNVIEPIFERKFIHDSYACRVGKGTHRALDRCTEFVRRYRFVLQCDVAKFFPTIDHAILLAILGRTIADPQVLRLCERIVRSGEGVLDSFATHRRLKRPNVVRFRRRLRGLQQAYASGSISLDKAGESIQSWCAHAAHGNTYRLRNQILRQTIFRPARI